ncbi:MAG TPA: hypothetical protein O0W95_01755, partial [Methanocorpusculum sp.]|nr:hypothetical protein [Methanocorpusculum sp.]
MKYKRLSWSVGFLSPDADYADYTTDSAFGRAAPNGRGDTDNIKNSNSQKRQTSKILLQIIKLRKEYSIFIC